MIVAVSMADRQAGGIDDERIDIEINVAKEMEVERTELWMVTDDGLVVTPKLRVGVAPCAHLAVFEVAERMMLEIALCLRLPPRRESVAVCHPRVLVARACLRTADCPP